MSTAVEVPRYVRLPGVGVVTVGALAGTEVPHLHFPDQWTGSSCMACFGWPDDPRHVYLPLLPARRGARKRGETPTGTRQRRKKGTTS